MVRFLVLLLAPSGFVAAATATTILVSIDGGRWDYPELHDARFLQEIAAEGVRVERLAPSFPSKTFPNHYTLVTGLRPESHGIIQNHFRDEHFDAWFHIGSHPAAREGRWWGGEPVWNTLERQGGIAASLFWPGAEADIGGHQPHHWLSYDESLPYTARIEQVLAWLRLPATERPDFIALYFEGVDTAGHDFGPAAEETGAAVHAVEQALRELKSGLLALGLWETTNLIVTADHGMTETSPARVIDLRSLVDLDQVEVIFDGALVGLSLAAGADTKTIVDRINATGAPLSAYQRENVPARYHYSANDRIPDVVLLPTLGWKIAATDADPDSTKVTGDHGFDAAASDMAGLFIARGPGFAAGQRIEVAENIHVYNLLCALLQVESAPNEGDDRLVKALLAKP